MFHCVREELELLRLVGSAVVVVFLGKAEMDAREEREMKRRARRMLVR